jgi:hypothetical protein
MKSRSRSGVAQRVRRKALARTAGVALLVLGSLFAAGPAQASGNCSESHKELPTPGYDVDLYVKVCATEGTSRRHGAYLIVSWMDAGGGANDGDRKFDGLRMHLRVERYDRDYTRDSWSLAGLVNRNESGTWSSPIIYAASTKRGGWTGDGYVKYDIDRDGEGYLDAWSLHGSPARY